MVGNKMFTVYLVELRESNDCIIPTHKEVKVKANHVEIEDKYVVFYNNFDDVVAQFKERDVVGYVREE